LTPSLHFGEHCRKTTRMVDEMPKKIGGDPF